MATRLIMVKWLSDEHGRITQWQLDLFVNLTIWPAGGLDGGLWFLFICDNNDDNSDLQGLFYYVWLVWFWER